METTGSMQAGRRWSRTAEFLEADGPFITMRTSFTEGKYAGGSDLKLHSLGRSEFVVGPRLQLVFLLPAPRPLVPYLNTNQGNIWIL